MGSNKNSRGSHACKGKYAKKKVPKQPPAMKETPSEDSKSGSRIINLSNLKDHLHEITQHAATCQACIEKALSTNQTIVLLVSTTAKDVPPFYHQGVLAATQHFTLQHPPGFKELLVVSTGRAIWLLCGGKWLQEEVTHH